MPRPAPSFLRIRGNAMPASAQQPRHPSLYLLGDHLDAALAMGEDLLTKRVVLADATQHLTMARLVRQNRELAEFLTTVRTLELSLTARLLQARKRAEDMRRRESRLKPLIALFVAGTAPLVDAAAELGDTTSRDFDTGSAPVGQIPQAYYSTQDGDLLPSDQPRARDRRQPARACLQSAT